MKNAVKVRYRELLKMKLKNGRWKELKCRKKSWGHDIKIRKTTFNSLLSLKNVIKIILLICFVLFLKSIVIYLTVATNFLHIEHIFFINLHTDWSVFKQAFTLTNVKHL